MLNNQRVFCRWTRWSLNFSTAPFQKGPRAVMQWIDTNICFEEAERSCSWLPFGVDRWPNRLAPVAESQLWCVSVHLPAVPAPKRWVSSQKPSWHNPQNTMKLRPAQCENAKPPQAHQPSKFVKDVFLVAGNYVVKLARAAWSACGWGSSPHPFATLPPSSQLSV